MQRLLVMTVVVVAAAVLVLLQEGKAARGRDAETRVPYTLTHNRQGSSAARARLPAGAVLGLCLRPGEAVAAP